MTPRRQFGPRDFAGELRAGGPLARDLAAVDWAATPLGPLESWPHSLRTTVRTMLGSRFAMWMAWGPDLTFLCNEAYRRDTLASKYPWALGRPAREVWAEIWPEIGPRIDHVMGTGDATWDEALQLYLRRSGFLEETYHTFSYSPLADDDGETAGMLCVVSEDTERVISARRMATLRDLGAATAAAVLTPDEVLHAACDVLSRNRSDVPFAALYIRAEATDKEPPGARLVGTAGLTEGQALAPSRLRAEDPGAIWPLVSDAATVVPIPDHVHDVPAGAQPLPPHSAQIVPLASSPGARPEGWLVVGLNPCRPMNIAHTGFLDLVARHISAGFSAGTAFQHQRARAEELAELDRAKTAFFTNVSHELRTPLTLMLGPLADALGDGAAPLPASHRDRIQIAFANAERLLGLVNSLLDLARLDAGGATIQFQRTDVGAYTAELASMFESVAGAAGLDLDVRVPPEPVPVPLDRAMWAKIVLNLLSNAVKHTFTGGITVELRVLDTEPGRSLSLAVADTGIGIDPADQERLFERFHRVDGARSRSHEGSGIGLALVAELTSALDGTVEVQSARGVGSTFTVTLPVPEAETDPEVESGHDQPAVDPRGLVAAAATWSAGVPADAPRVDDIRPCLLVVDDNADMRRYLTSLLSGQFRVLLAVDGADALEKIAEDPPDLVLTDVMMPRLDGFGLVGALRADPTTAELPVIMLSARAGEDGIAEGLEAGADDYLVKPFTARELLARVRANLELERSRRMRAELERSRELLDQAQRLARVGSWEVDLATERITCSQEFARMLGRTVEEVNALDLQTALETFLHPQDRRRISEALQAGILGAPISYEAMFRTPAGADVLMEIVGELETDAEGLPVRLRGSIQDIGERRQAERRSVAEQTARQVATREHQIAEELQASLLPALNFDPDHLEVATFYKAGVEGTQVGGDWYDVIELGAGRTALVIGDVMGRGVRAAAVMGQLRSAIRAYARLDLAPADVLELCDGAVRDLGEDQIVTCIYAVFDPVENSLSYANAGHLPPVLASGDGPARRLASGGSAPLGSGPLTVTGQTLDLPPGSTLALYTDGLVERRDRDIDVGVDLLAQELATATADLAAGPAVLVSRLLPEGPDDDVALLLARVREGDRQIESAVFEVEAELNQVAASRAFVTRVLAEWGVAGATAADAVLLTGELVTNALTHGQGTVQVRLRHTRDALMLEVSDQAPFLPRRLRSGLEDEHGRGLLLVTRLSERWGVRPTPTGKSVWCVLALGPG